MLYGGANSDPEDPSPDSAKITESLVLLEFIADLYPDSGLLPKDPVERARARFFIDAITTKLIPPSNIFFFCGNASEPFVTALAEIQDLLPLDAQFAVGDYFTIADAALAPWLGRWELYLRNDVGKYREGIFPRVYEEVFKSERFARFQKYYASISSRESFKSSFDSVRVLF